MLKDMIKQKFRINKLKFVMSFFLISLILFFSFFPFSIFNFDNNFYDDFKIVKSTSHYINANEKEITVNSLAQKILAAINGDDDVSNIFKSFSDEEKNGISLAEFSQYIQYLNKGHLEKLISFYKLSEKDRKVLDKDISSHISEPDYLQKLDFYFFDSEDETLRILFPFEINDNGNYCIATKYIHDALDLYSYANLYFSAVRNEDRNTLKKLIYNENDDEELLDIKVNNILEYYSSSDEQNNNLNMDLLVFRLDSVAFVQSRTYVDNGDISADNINENTIKKRDLKLNKSRVSSILRESQTTFSFGNSRAIWIIRKNNEVKVLDKINDLNNIFSKYKFNGVEYNSSDIYSDFSSHFINQAKIQLSFGIESKELDSATEDFFKQQQINSFNYYENSNYRLATVKYKSGEEKLLFLAIYGSNDLLIDNNSNEKKYSDLMNCVYFDEMDKIFSLNKIDLMKKYLPLLDINHNQLTISSDIKLKMNFNKEDKLDHLNFYTEEWLDYGSIYNEIFPKMN